MSDLIDRQAVIGALRKKSQVAFDTLTTEEVSIITQSDAEKVIAEIPSVQPERTGRWVEMGQNKDGTHNICCGVCGKFKIKSRGHANSDYTKSKYRFCGGCGAKMDGKDGEG